MGEVLKATMNAMQARHESGGIAGLQTGYTGIDAALGGLIAGGLYIVAARPAMGKTAYALNVLLNAALDGKPGAIFSLEMSATELGGRLLSATSRVPGDKSARMMSASDHARIGRATETLRQAPITVVDSSMLTAVELRSHARKLHAQNKLALLIVDYLQLMTGKGESREREIGEISRSMKLIAKELGVPVIALSQLNRGVENRTEKRPTLSDLRDSGSIEQDADAVLFLYRDEVYNEKTPDKGIAEIIIAKNRHGATTKVRLRFDAPTQRFDNLHPERPQ
jgi:replicative DNA helicase